MDLLPPGNMPVPNADGDDVRDFPDQFGSVMWPSLYPRVIHWYATFADRNADFAGLGIGDVAFAWVDVVKAVTTWNGTIWVLATPIGGQTQGLTNIYGQIAVAHGLDYIPSWVTATLEDVQGSYAGIYTTTAQDGRLHIYSKDAVNIKFRVRKTVGGPADWASVNVAILWSAM